MSKSPDQSSSDRPPSPSDSTKLRFALLQFSPQVGAFNANVAAADALLFGPNGVQPGEIDLLVLPEMAFSGNFPPSLTRMHHRHLNSHFHNPKLTLLVCFSFLSRLQLSIPLYHHTFPRTHLLWPHLPLGHRDCHPPPLLRYRGLSGAE